MKKTVINAQKIQEVVSELVQIANISLPQDVENAISLALKKEKNPHGIAILKLLIANSRMARHLKLPICQDTGIDTVFLEIGQGISIDGDIQEAINKGIAEGTEKGFLRASVCDPLTRKNTGNNSPAVIHTELTPSDGLAISLLPKGCGSENMSALYMLPPSEGIEGIIKTIKKQVEKAWANPCPPGIIGIGIGGTMEKAAFLSKKALLRPLGVLNKREDVAQLEERLFLEINKLGIGPSGLGGNTTTLGVAVELYPCHIASLPLAINIQCHAARNCKAIFHNGKWEYSQTAEEGKERLKKTIKKMIPDARVIDLPFKKKDLESLRAGDWVLLNGTLYTGRDQTHKKIVEMLKKGETLPVDLKGQLVYYVGPSPAPPGRPVGSAGPTTSYRMDAYTPQMLAAGVVATKGKGKRSEAVKDAKKKHEAIYLASIGGLGALLGNCVTRCELIAFPELGPEALYKMEVKDFPAIVINDVLGNDYYEEVKKNRI